MFLEFRASCGEADMKEVSQWHSRYFQLPRLLCFKADNLSFPMWIFSPEDGREPACAFLGIPKRKAFSALLEANHYGANLFLRENLAKVVYRCFPFPGKELAKEGKIVQDEPGGQDYLGKGLGG
jgi:hypothetical protein